MRRYKTALQIAIVVVPVLGWFFSWLSEPFFRMTGEQWGYLVFLLSLMMMVWIAGSRAAYSPSPPMYFVTVAIAFATGYMASGAPSPVFAVRRAKAPFLSGCDSRPATVAPAGSSRSG